MIKGVRSKLGLSQAQFAQLLGVTPSAIFLWESGQRQPEGPALRLIYALQSQLEEKKPRKDEMEKLLQSLAVGAAAVGFVALLAALFSGKRR